MGSGLARQPARSPRPHPGTPKGLRAEGLERGAERRRGRPQWGRWAPPPRDGRLALGAGRGSEALRARSPVPDRRPPHTYQHDGKSLLQFTWLRHRQLQRHVVRPEICLLRIHAPRVAHVGCTPGPGAAPGPSRPRRKSEQLRATSSRPLRDLRGSPPSAAPRRLCSAHRSLAALGAEPPPGLPHAPRRPSAAPASFPREGSSGRQAPICMLLHWHAAPCQRSQTAGAWLLRLGLPLGPRPPLTLPAHGRRAPRSLREHLEQTNAAPRSRHNAPSRPAPALGPAPPTRPADCRDA